MLPASTGRERILHDLSLVYIKFRGKFPEKLSLDASGVTTFGMPF
jgi:hypothetical protein